MSIYLLFILVTSVVILTPGPGVVLTLSHSIRYGAVGALPGVLGLACGSFVVAAVAATGLGLLLETSALAYTVLKYLGAVYLVYLGIRQWRAPAIRIDGGSKEIRGARAKFIEGALVQALNPKAIVFFVSIFPQFVDKSSSQVSQFALLVSTYSLLIIVIHMTYALVATAARGWLTSPSRGRLLGRASGVTFFGFGIGMAAANR